MVTRVRGSPYLCARVTLAGGLTFSLVNTPSRANPQTRVNFLAFPDPLRVTAHQVVPSCRITLPVKFWL